MGRERESILRIAARHVREERYDFSICKLPEMFSVCVGLIRVKFFHIAIFRAHMRHDSCTVCEIGHRPSPSYAVLNFHKSSFLIMSALNGIQL